MALTVLEKQFLDEWVDENGYPAEQVGEDPNLIILGEYHKSPTTIHQQDRLLFGLRPKVLLSESVSALRFKPGMEYPVVQRGRKYDWREMERYPEMKLRMGVLLRRRVEIANGIDMRLVGIDLTQREVDILWKENAERYGWKAKENVRPHLKLCATEPIMELRDEQMGTMITRYAKRVKTPLVAIVGTQHLREGSKIYQKLAEEGIPYLKVIMFKDGKPTADGTEYWPRDLYRMERAQAQL